MERDDYTALTREAGFWERSRRGLISIEGEDRAEYLQGQLTNDVLALPSGAGCYAAYLTPHGRMIADMVVLNLGATLWLDVHESVTAALVARFEELVFAEDVRVSDESGAWTSFAVAGPLSAERLAAAAARLGVDTGLDDPTSYGLYQVGRHPDPDREVVAARTDALGVRGYDLWVRRGAAVEIREALLATGCAPVSESVADVVRIEQGRPAFPGDLDTTTIPLEAGIEDRAVSFSKGCYVGQEVIIRVMHRGQGRVARRLVGLLVDLETAPAEGGLRSGAILRHQGHDIGRLTSVAWSPGVGRVIALGYVAREQTEPGTALEVVTDGGPIAARVTALPFQV